jgi:16S rRNA U1498 N3-methylase RsmE
MDSRGWGCRITGMGCGALAIFAFFAALMNFTEGAARSYQVKAQRDDVARDMALLVAAAREYATASGGKLPPTDSFAAFKAALYPALIAEEDRFTRKGDNLPYRPNALISRKLLAGFKDPSSVLVLTGPEGGLMKKDEKVAPLATAYLDGSVRW